MNPERQEQLTLARSRLWGFYFRPDVGKAPVPESVEP
jgi:hypothetical protein